MNVSDFSFWCRSINAFVPVINECESENIYVLHVSPGIENIFLSVTSLSSFVTNLLESGPSRIVHLFIIFNQPNINNRRLKK